MTPDERQQAIDAIKEHFPDELLQLDQWVLWRLVKRRGGDAQRDRLFGVNHRPAHVGAL